MEPDTRERRNPKEIGSKRIWEVRTTKKQKDRGERKQETEEAT